MILFPNAKINLGLYITGKRLDGYHDISTVMIPVGWRDVLELTPGKGGASTLTVYGRTVDCPPEKNLVMKAYHALADYTGGLPPVDFYLQKVIPDGAGLGGGSADAAFALQGLNELFNIGLPERILADVAAKIGADCPFFIYNRPALCEGIGDRISFNVVPRLSGRGLLIVKPQVATVSTREAYAGVTPKTLDIDIESVVSADPSTWQCRLRNDFEASVFARLPLLSEVKEKLLELGAIYASMTGSGAAVYGIFDDVILAESCVGHFPGCDKIAVAL